MKIALVTGEYPPMQGGVGAFSQKLAHSLASEGHQIHVITSRKARPPGPRRGLWDLNEPYEQERVQLHPVARRWWWGDIGRVADVAHRYGLELVNLQYQAAAFSMNVPAVNFLPWRLRGLVKTVVTFHDLRVPYLFPKAGRLRQGTLLRLARSADGVIATNQDDYRKLLSAGLDPRRLAQIPIGSNIAARPPDAEAIGRLRDRLGLKHGSSLLGYFGFLSPSKGADLLIDALAKLPESVHLAFIGGRTGSSDPGSNQAFLQKVEQRIASLNVAERIHWSGYVEDQEVSNYLHAADVMVMPYRDGVTLRRGTLMAILAHGRPLITSKPQVQLRELVNGQNVHYAPVEDAASLAGAINALLADAEMRDRLSKQALELAAAFSWERIAVRSAEFFQRMSQPL